jgi:bifunctional DNA-binding transcriptional regulator/antitoxin component of YhaV-PrlF toxin-antitoxin module
MSKTISTVTSKWQVTIPEAVRKQLPFAIGQRIAWEVEGDKLIGRRVRAIHELAGSLTSHPRSGGGGEFGEAALARHDRISKQKPRRNIC